MLYFGNSMSVLVMMNILGLCLGLNSHIPADSKYNFYYKNPMYSEGHGAVPVDYCHSYSSPLYSYFFSYKFVCIDDNTMQYRKYSNSLDCNDDSYSVQGTYNCQELGDDICSCSRGNDRESLGDYLREFTDHYGGTPDGNGCTKDLGENMQTIISYFIDNSYKCFKWEGDCCSGDCVE